MGEYEEKETELQAALASGRDAEALAKQAQHESKLLAEQNAGLQQRTKALERDLEGKTGQQPT